MSSPEVSRNRLAVRRRRVHRPTRSRNCTTFAVESGCVSCTLLFGFVLAQAVDLAGSTLALLLGLQNGGADGAAPGVLRGHEEVCSASSEKASRSAPVTPAFCDTAPISATGAATGRPFTIELLKLRATASHSPRRISAGE